MPARKPGVAVDFVMRSSKTSMLPSWLFFGGTSLSSADKVLPDAVKAEQHRKMAEPGGGS